MLGVDFLIFVGCRKLNGVSDFLLVGCPVKSGVSEENSSEFRFEVALSAPSPKQRIFLKKQARESPKRRFSYEQNINIVSEQCKGCYTLYPNTYYCAKGLDEPECMYSISPEFVVAKSVEYLRSL